MSFRAWMDQLRGVQGDQPNWPWLLGAAIADELSRQVAIDDGYEGEVFKDRDNHEFQEGSSERRLVQTLYHRCLAQNQGCLEIDSERFWLLGYEWPNQGGMAEKGRRADLIGMTKSGGLVVFECKREDNTDPPITAMVEGLDYLACLLRPMNFQQISDGFQAWVNKPGKQIPEGFEGVVPVRDNPAIVVLAPAIYYLGRYSRSRRGEGWSEIGSVGCQAFLPVTVQFAASDFESPIAHWVS